MSACGGGEFTKDELDAAVAKAVEEALADVEGPEASSPTTEAKASATTTAAVVPSTSNTAASTTTTQAAELDESDPRMAKAIDGNGAPPLAAGDPGVLSVVGAAWSATRSGDTWIFLIVRNNTDESVKGIEVAYTVRDGGGGLLASGDTLFPLRPYRVSPGQIAFGDSFLSDVELPDNAQMEFQVTASDRSESRDNNVDLGISEHVRQGSNVVVIVSNRTDFPIELASAGVMCFFESGLISWYADAFVDLDVIPPGGTSPVSVDIRDAECPIYLIASRGLKE